MKHKIIFVGPAGAGKTTALAALSDVAPTVIDRLADAVDSGPAPAGGLEHGLAHLADDLTLHLYAMRGQLGLDAVEQLVAQGAVGLVLLIDNTRPDPLADLRFFAGGLWKTVARAGLVIGITRTDIRPYPMMDDYYRELQALNIASTPAFEVDARARKDVSLLVEALLCWAASVTVRG